MCGVPAAGAGGRGDVWQDNRFKSGWIPATLSALSAARALIGALRPPGRAAELALSLTGGGGGGVLVARAAPPCHSCDLTITAGGRPRGQSHPRRVISLYCRIPWVTPSARVASLVKFPSLARAELERWLKAQGPHADLALSRGVTGAAQCSAADLF